MKLNNKNFKILVKIIKQLKCKVNYLVNKRVKFKKNKILIVTNSLLKIVKSIMWTVWLMNITQNKKFFKIVRNQVK